MAGMGFQPIGIQGQGFGVQNSEYEILANYATNIFQGDTVAMTTDGTIDLALSADIDAFDLVGVFMGCSYVDTGGQQQWSNHYPASQNEEGIIAYVADHPRTLFKVKLSDGSGVDGTLDRTSVGLNFDIDVTNAGSTQSGISGQMLGNNAGVTTVAQFRLIRLVNDDVGPLGARSATTTYTHGIVMVQPEMHFYDQLVGI